MASFLKSSVSLFLLNQMSRAANLTFRNQRCRQSLEGGALGKSIPKVRAVPGDALSEIPLGPFDSLGVTVQRHRHAMCIRFARNLVPYARLLSQDKKTKHMSFRLESCLSGLQFLRWVTCRCWCRVSPQLPVNPQWSGEGPVFGQVKVQSFVGRRTCNVGQSPRLRQQLGTSMKLQRSGASPL